MESTELQLYSLPESSTDLEAAFISDDYTDRLIEEVRSKAKSVVGDLNTAKGRKAYISMAATVRSSKVAIDDAGKALVAEMKKRPALVDASRRKIREALDELAIEIRQPVTDWEAEQERIKAEDKFNADHAEALEMNAAFDKALAERIESDHEIALLMNDKIDRDRAESARIAEQQRIEHEQRIAREAEERVKREAEEKAQREREESARREYELKAKAEQAERERIAEIERLEREAKEAKERAEREAKELQERNERLAREAKEKAEREKQEAIEAERRKAREAEKRRLAEEQRIKDENERRQADENHRKRIGTDVVNALIDVVGLNREQAIRTLTAIKDGAVPHTKINY
ncbi:hypothetical protein [Rosenbergiella epipactidis]|uniref:hypothetical protein n=1 Tax=Rosenbergiella epipactidis TaxID=1544694 RepID=UPI001F4E4DF4|nr:hypothetical protein [Rosenbergiella epipactidis]